MASACLAVSIPTHTERNEDQVLRYNIAVVMKSTLSFE